MEVCFNEGVFEFCLVMGWPILSVWQTFLNTVESSKMFIGSVNEFGIANHDGECLKSVVEFWEETKVIVGELAR